MELNESLIKTRYDILATEQISFEISIGFQNPIRLDIFNFIFMHTETVKHPMFIQ